MLAVGTETSFDVLRKKFGVQLYLSWHPFVMEVVDSDATQRTLYDLSLTSVTTPNLYGGEVVATLSLTFIVQ